MVRAPCCQKIGLKKGSWTVEEDRKLIAHIQKHGHTNWRSLPKQAGLLRCGKSCRLRWMNYLRPDIKRGNFSEEEEAIISSHEELGNRWSAIAAKLPGRTDNEIKNVWNTNLKKRLMKHNKQLNSGNKQNSETITKPNSDITTSTQFAESSMSFPQPCCSDLSSSVSASSGKTNLHQCINGKDDQIVDSFDKFTEIDESFWAETLSEKLDFGGAINEFQIDDNMKFWYNILVKTRGDLTLQI